MAEKIELFVFSWSLFKTCLVHLHASFIGKKSVRLYPFYNSFLQQKQNLPA